MNKSSISVKRVSRDDPEVGMVADWLAKDELHQSLGLTMEDVFAHGPIDLISDEQGPLIAVRTHLAMRAAMQFRPESRLRIARIGSEVVDWMKREAKDRNCSEVVIRPGGKAQKFAEKLGFREFIGKYLGV
jgi:hypothetical protein